MTSRSLVLTMRRGLGAQPLGPSERKEPKRHYQRRGHTQRRGAEGRSGCLCLGPTSSPGASLGEGLQEPSAASCELPVEDSTVSVCSDSTGWRGGHRCPPPAGRWARRQPCLPTSSSHLPPPTTPHLRGPCDPSQANHCLSSGNV